MSSSSVVLSNLTLTMPITNSSSMIVSILIGICLSIIALITALGNIVVLLAFYCDKKLRTINDYFILNMAIADFLVGCFCIPFYIPFSITQFWPFGRLFCKIWVTVDDVATMASVINIVAISINRYWSIAYPLSYRKYVKQHFVYIVMGGVWCLAFLNFAPGIWLLSLFDRGNIEMNVTRSDCSGDYNNWFVYMLIAQFNYFIWPFIVLCILNMLLMLNIWKRSRKLNRVILSYQINKIKEDNLISSPLGTSKELEDDQQHLGIDSKHPINRCPSIIPEENETCLFPDKSYLSVLSSKIKPSPKLRNSAPIVYLSHKSSHVSRNYQSASMIEYQLKSEIEIPRRMYNELSTSNISINRSQPIRTGQSRIVRDQKAARSLFILVIVFLIFLFPYVICATASTAGVNISTIVFEISFWLLWLNSTCNPFLYPFIQMKYRRAYVKLFQSVRDFFTCLASNRTI